MFNTPMQILPNINVDYLDEVLLNGNYLKLLSSDTYKKIDQVHLCLWAHTRARYTLPTIELINWLEEKIRGRFSIELGSGQGDLGYHLGIIQTDSYMQSLPECEAYYKLLGQKQTKPPEDIYEFEALEAVEGLRPKVAIASWLTQLVVPEECDVKTQGSVYGADEISIINNVEMYIHIGNEGSHKQKKALVLPHEEYCFPWLISRSADQEKNIIYVWGK